MIVSDCYRPAIGLAAVALAAIAFAQNPTSAFPNNYKLLIDNPDVAVLRAHYGPHETVGVHDHSAFSTVYVYLNDSGPVRFSHFEAHPFSIVRPPTHTGAFRVSPGRLERHSVENLSDLPSDYLRIELKHLPVKALPAEFRGSAPTPPLTAGTSIAYATRASALSAFSALPASPAKFRPKRLRRFWLPSLRQPSL
jgi:hypothetical protein